MTYPSTANQGLLDKEQIMLCDGSTVVSIHEASPYCLKGQEKYSTAVTELLITQVSQAIQASRQGQLPRPFCIKEERYRLPCGP